MRLAVLASPSSWYLEDLRRAAGDAHRIECIAFDRLWADLYQDQGGTIQAEQHRLGQFDAVLVRTMPPGSLEQVVFRMNALGQIAQAGVTVLNPPRAIEIAVDKYLASARLLDAGLPTPRTRVCQSVDEAMAAFDALGGDVVVKPVFGGEGRGIIRVEDESLARRVFGALVQIDAVIYVQKFVRHHGYDIRLLVLGDQVYGMRRINDVDWRTNVSRGARTEPLVPDPTLVDIARRASAAVGAPFVGVDVLPDQSGNLYVLEVNAVPGWRALARTLKIDVAARLLAYLASQNAEASVDIPAGPD